MRIWLIGAGHSGAAALRQLQKNGNVEIIISDPERHPTAVATGLVDQVDYQERVTPLNVNQLAQQIQPDLILIAAGSGTTTFGHMTGAAMLANSLNYEIAQASDYPCLLLSGSNIL